jgi:hypothetical protein
MKDLGRTEPAKPNGTIRWPSNEALVDGLLLAGVAALLLPRVVLLGEVLFERDVQLVWHPQTEAFVRAVASGAAPLWDPHVAFGHPMLANPNTQVLYPPTWLNLIVPAHVYYALYALAHLWLAGLGARALGREIGLSRRAAIVCAGVFMASGPVVSLVNVWHHLAGAAWIPFVVYAGERALKSPSGPRVAAWGVIGALQLLAGSPDMSLFLLLLEVGHVAWRVIGARSPRILVPAAVAGAIALGLTAAQWLPTLELLRGSARESLAEGMRGGWAVSPFGLFQVFSPMAWTRLPLGDAVRGRLFDGGHPFMRSIYLGVPALLLVGAAVAARGRRVVVLGLLGGVALAYSLGRALPVYELAITLFPPLGFVRYPSKAMVVVALVWALLCGIGSDRMRGLFPRRTSWPVLILACGGAAVALVAWWAPAYVGRAIGAPSEMPIPLLRGALDPMVRKLTVAAVLAAISAWVATRRGWPTAVAALTVIDLVAAHHDLNATVAARFYRFRPPALEVVRRDPSPRVFVRRYPMDGSSPLVGGRNAYRVARQPEGMSFDAARALSVRLYMLPPLAASFGVYGSFDPDLLGLYPPHLRRLVEWRERVEGTEAELRLLQAGGVGHVLALHEPALEGLVPEGTFESLLAEPIRAYRVPDPLPRAYCVTGVRVASAADAPAVVSSAGFDRRREVVLGDGAPRSPTAGRHEARLASFLSDRLEVEVEMSDPGYLVVLETYDPGWRASVGERDAPVLPANGAFLAVPVPAGRHLVRLVYRPRSAALGASISASVLALLGVFAGTGLARRSPRG